MVVEMNAEIVRVGNSKGLRIPKAILKQCKIKNNVNLTVKGHTLIITACEEARAGWGKAFQLMAKNGDDNLLDEDNIVHSWDEDEWQW